MYIYKITCLINNKIYIGQCIKNKEKTKNYFGSGYIISKAINKYGKDKFKKEILFECNNINELNDAEIYYIKKYNSTNKSIGYNIRSGGNNSVLAEISKKRISCVKKQQWEDGNSVYNSVEYKQKRKLIDFKKEEPSWNKGLTKNNDERVAKYGKTGSKTLKNLYKSGKLEPWNKNKINVYSNETIYLMSNSAKNRKIDTKTEIKRREKISNFMSTQHPNSIKIVDVRDNKIYKDGKEFRELHPGKTGNEMTWYKYKKLIDKGVIKKYEN